MGIFDVIGPVMVGPSSSHTAGAVRIGLFARLLLGSQPDNAEIALHGSFAATGEGHGTHLALLAGLLGLGTDDERIPEARHLAEEARLHYTFCDEYLGEVHPNSVRIKLVHETSVLEILASSVGGGRIRVFEIDGFPLDLDGEYPTILMAYPDQPGWVAVVSSILANAQVNLASIQAHRASKGGQALLTIKCDQVPPSGTLEALRALPKTNWVRFIPALG